MTQATNTPRHPELFFPENEEGYLEQVERPVRHRWNAPAVLLPVQSIDPDQVADHFPQLREQSASLILSSFGLDLETLSIAGSLHPPIQRLVDEIRFLAAHHRRHISQAERVKRTPEFPAFTG